MIDFIFAFEPNTHIMLNIAPMDTERQFKPEEVRKQEGQMIHLTGHLLQWISRQKDIAKLMSVASIIPLRKTKYLNLLNEWSLFKRGSLYIQAKSSSSSYSYE